MHPAAHLPTPAHSTPSLSTLTPLSRRLSPPDQRRQRHHGERGAVAVEFAIVLPLLIVLVFGIIEFGRAYNAKVALQAAVREGARVLAIDSGDPVSATVNAAPSLDASQINVSTSGSPCTQGQPATVTATYPFEYDVPLFGSATVTLESTGVMRCAG